MKTTINDLFKDHTIDPAYIEQKRKQRRLDIQITTKCSLQCPYCIGQLNHDALQHRKTFLDEMGTDAFLAKIHQLFDGRGVVNFGIPGAGEPTEHPDFVRIMKELLSFGGLVKITTNMLHGERILKICQEMGYTKAQAHEHIQLAISYHYGALKVKGDVGQKLRKHILERSYPAIIESGVQINAIITPMSPDLLWDDQFIKDIEYFQQFAKFIPTLGELYGQYNHKTYPHDYTKEERIQLARIQEHFNYNYLNHGLAQIETTEKQAKKPIDPDAIQYMTNYLMLHGKKCTLPMSYASLDVHGNINWCNSTPVSFRGRFQDNITYEDIFMDDIIPCPFDICQCKSSGNSNCLFAHGIGLEEYYYAWYKEEKKEDIAKLFEVD
jgi:MoaA/NifB/PqqE/SkfB family radical SAM enzyme